MDKINVYINSKNRDLTEQISSFTVRIPHNLLRLAQDEYFTLNVNGFYCYNSWFNCIDGFNNDFHIIINNKIALMKIHQRQIICVEDWTRRPPRGPHPQGFTYTLSQTHTQSYTSLTRIHTHMTILTHFHSKPVQHHVRFLTCFSFPPY